MIQSGSLASVVNRICIICSPSGLVIIHVIYQFRFPVVTIFCVFPAVPTHDKEEALASLLVIVSSRALQKDHEVRRKTSS